MDKSGKSVTTSDQKGQLGSGAQAEPSDWEEFTPDVSFAIGRVSFSFKCLRSGSFCCTRTGLVFVVDGEADLQYDVVQWNDDLLRSAGSMAAGPLVRINCSENVVRQVHFLHCEAEPAKTPPRVACVSEDGLSFINPLKVTASHVVIDYTCPSLYGLVATMRQFFKSVTIQVQMFLTRLNTRTRRQNFFLVLLPKNVPMDQVKNQHVGDKFARDLPQCTLQSHHKYSIQCPGVHLVQPKEDELHMDFGPNFHPMFDVCVVENTKQVTVTVLDKDKKTMWEHTVDVPDSHPPLSTHKLDSSRLDFIDFVSEPTLSTLMEKLLEKRILTPIEVEWAQTRNKEDRARQVIDTVKHKGVEASSTLIAVLCEVDPDVAKQVRLM